MSVRRPSPGSVAGVLLETVHGLVANRVLQMSAALAYYSALSLAPLVIITFGVTGLLVDRRLVEDHLVSQLERYVGPDGANLIRSLGNEQRTSAVGAWATVAGVAMLLLAASAVFGQLHDGLNVIWGVTPRPHRRLLRFLRRRLVSMAMVFCLGAVLLASMLVNTLTSAMGADIGDLLGSPTEVPLAFQLGSSFAITATVFALLFKWLPDAKVTWRQAWSGALLTAALFHLGAWAIGQYVGRAAIGSAYGAAGSLVVVLVWVYYAALIVFTGAQFARALATRPTTRS